MYNMFANITSRSLQGPHQAFFLIWSISALTRIFFKLLALRNPITGTSLNTSLCLLSGVKRMCILVIMTFNSAREGSYVILRISLSLFSFFLWLLSNSALESFLAFKICFHKFFFHLFCFYSQRDINFTILQYHNQIFPLRVNTAA